MAATALLHPRMTDPRFVGERTGVFALAQGRVLDLCFEPEANPPYYSPWVTSAAVLCLDPSRPRSRRRRRTSRGLPCEQVFTGGEIVVPFRDREFDWVVSVLSLCRVPDPRRLLAQLRRVLKPGGVYGFIEHGSSADPRVLRYQSAANAAWQRLGGCDLMRPIDVLLEELGFRIERLDRFALPAPRVLAAVYRGTARL